MTTTCIVNRRRKRSNGVDVNILKISQFEEIAPLLSGLNLGQKIRFKRNFETWGRSATIEIISEAIDPDASVIEINQSHSTCGQKTPLKSPNKTSGYIISSPSSAPSSVYLENVLRSPELRSTADKTAVPAESIRSQCASKNLFGKTQGTITCSDSLGLVIQRNALIGQSITHFYHAKGFLDKSSRNKLAKLIISAELSESVHIKIDTSRFLKLAEWIVEIFPTEKREIWFTPFKSIQGKKRVPARGKLVDLYHNIRRNLIKAQIISSRRSSSQVQIAVSPTEGGIDEEVQLKIDWLKKTGTPFSTAADYWRETFSHRRHNFIQHDISIHKYFEDFGLLKTNSGSKLLSLDFDYLYPDHSQNLFSLWPIFKEKIFSYFKGKVENNKGLESVANVLGIDLTVEGDDLSTVHALRALALLLAVCKPIKGSKLTWKPTKGDAVDGVMTIVLSSADLKNTVERRKALHVKFGLSLQPLPLVVINQSLKSCSSYVVINNIIYNLDSPIVALDFCFKSFHVLNAKYPTESRQAWNFIQTQMYKLKTEGDDNFVSVQNFVHDLELL